MIKGIATDEYGRKVLLVGLSFGNLDRFRDAPGDTYIRVSGAEMGIDVDVLIFSGETEEKMALEMAQRDTKIYSHRDET